MNSFFARHKTLSRLVSVFMLFAAFQVSGIKGCASGGYRATRWLASINNSQPLILRILIYVGLALIGAYAVTLLIDIIVLNTIDFWSGSKVANSDHQLEKDGYQYALKNRVLENGLRRTEVQVTQPSGAKHEIVLAELTNRKIELLVDGIKKVEIDRIHDLHQILKTMDALGQVQNEIVITPEELASEEAQYLFSEKVAATLKPLAISQSR